MILAATSLVGVPKWMRYNIVKSDESLLGLKKPLGFSVVNGFRTDSGHQTTAHWGTGIGIVMAGVKEVVPGHIVVVADEVSPITKMFIVVAVLGEWPGGVVLMSRPDAQVNGAPQASAGEPGQFGRGSGGEWIH